MCCSVLLLWTFRDNWHSRKRRSRHIRRLYAAVSWRSYHWVASSRYPSWWLRTWQVSMTLHDRKPTFVENSSYAQLFPEHGNWKEGYITKCCHISDTLEQNSLDFYISVRWPRRHTTKKVCAELFIMNTPYLVQNSRFEEVLQLIGIGFPC